MSSELAELIIDSSKGNKSTLLEIINIFMPLIKKYSRKLNYDGTESDITIALIKVVKNYPVINNFIQDCDCISYINISIKHEYIRLSKKNYYIISRETELNEDIGLIYEDKENDDKILVKQLLYKLPIIQRDILINIFLKDYSEASIAKKFHVSRQAINKNKRKALRTLKMYI